MGTHGSAWLYTLGSLLVGLGNPMELKVEPGLAALPLGVSLQLRLLEKSIGRKLKGMEYMLCMQEAWI